MLSDLLCAQRREGRSRARTGARPYRLGRRITLSDHTSGDHHDECHARRNTSDDAGRRPASAAVGEVGEAVQLRCADLTGEVVKLAQLRHLRAPLL
jgi:hypothetical protein